MGRSYELARASFSVLKRDKEILLLPSMAGAIMLITLIATILALINSLTSSGMLFIQLFICSIIIVPLFFAFLAAFFQAAIVGCAFIRLEGDNPDIRDGLKVAIRNAWPLLQWAIIGVIVGVLLEAIRTLLNALSSESGRLNYPSRLSRLENLNLDRLSPYTNFSDEEVGLGDIIAGGLGLAWAAATFLVIPVIIQERVSAVRAIARSAKLVKEVWSETFILSLGFGALFVFVGFLGGLAIVFISAALKAGGIGLAIASAYWTILACLYFSLKGILRAAVYQLSVKQAMRQSCSEKFDTLIRYVNSASKNINE